ncbi:hypothetical protein KIL84_005279 [Mauremys mutica]|uniref:Uncharacterized protein n=1 Tax=Mauremys mutica TaxID=74926 RepID=A0A9D3XLN1_9SAUR|nr:hypothetical protein KIL84_005279 [Mauremys mutica]
MLIYCKKGTIPKRHRKSRCVKSPHHSHVTCDEGTHQHSTAWPRKSRHKGKPGGQRAACGLQQINANEKEVLIAQVEEEISFRSEEGITGESARCPDKLRR